MSIRPEQPEPFLRGCVFPAVSDAPYPRADPAGAEYLPADVWDAAQLPVGVRLEMVGDARTIRIWYKTTRASLGYRGESAGCSFVAYRAGQKVAVADAVMGEGMAEMVVSGRPELPLTVYIPEGMQPLITGVAGVEDTMVPAPAQPRWLAYGDAVTQGWLASAPAMAWPAVAGRKLGLDVCNLGYAGTARGEMTSALMLAETPAEVVTIAFGLNNWSRVPHTTGLMAEEVRCFLSVVRNGHPDVPIVVVSPTARPDAEDVPNRLGATLAELRRAMEETVIDCMADGDKALFLVEGLSTVDPEDLEDGMYPGDEGHRRLAAAVSKILVPYLAELQTAAETRWATEAIAADPFSATSVFDTAVTEAPVFDTPVFDTTVFDTPGFEPSGFDTPGFESPVTDSQTFDAGVAEGEGALSDFVSWDEAVLDDAALDFSTLDGELTDGAARNFDLPDLDSTDRTSLNDALLDALAPNGSSPVGAEDEVTAGVTPVDVVPADEEHAATLAVAGASVDPDTVHFDDPLPFDDTVHFDDTLPLDDTVHFDDTVAFDETVASDDTADSDTVSVPAEPVGADGLVDGLPESEIPMDDTAPVPAPVPAPVGHTANGHEPSGHVPIGYAGSGHAANGHAANARTPNGSSPAVTTTDAGHPTTEDKAGRRDTAPVDIAVADMVVAALSIATNGADDVIFVQDSGSNDELRWAETADPAPY